MELTIKFVIGAVLGIIMFVVCFYLISKYVIKGVYITYNISKGIGGG